ncbi:hypothetical protein Rhe02_33270 [Rhizocola hellebori]|uniref:DUF2029 domain-containing protein n=1 Tax=Rhizocola hellebori TaxID=1392758 RepID=A0A8J3VGC0_9ACTN|nr:glycosyltransferase 87 family protein [Rhizocola hellebori]GIH05260.1 hypothetical protein Rhe02_33270 [Rhizocola hellebori]
MNPPQTMLRTVGAAACLAALGLCVWWLVHPPAWQGAWTWYVLMGSAWVLFACGAWLVRGVPRKAAVALIILGAIGLPLAAGFAPPRTSDDLYRYIWDGRVQADGIGPYRYVPAAPELVHLRDDFLWPQHSTWCVPATASQGQPDVTQGCSLINRPTVPTIYPPVAQAFFLAVQALSPSGSQEGPMQVAAVLAVLAVAILLVIVLPKTGADPRLAALWAWCPLVAIEAGNNAHLDVISTLLTVAALLVAGRAATWRGTAAGAALLGLAIATKIIPVVAGPSMLRRRPLLVAGTALLTVILVYLPHVLGTGAGVLGYLPDYLTGEGYDTGSRFALLLFLPSSLRLGTAVVILAATAAYVFWHSDPDRPWRSATIMAGVMLLVATPGYSWYTILLVALAAMSDRPEWLAVVAAGYVAQYYGNLHLEIHQSLQIGYGVAALVVVATTLLRQRPLWKTRTA